MRMPSSHELIGSAPVVAEPGAPGPTVGATPTAAVAVELPDLGALGSHTVRTQAPPAAPRFQPLTADSETTPAPVFQLAADSGIPEEVLAPARAAAQAAGYAAGWSHGARAARLVSDAEFHAAEAHRRQAAAQQAADVRRAIGALDVAAGELELRSVPAAQEIEDLIVSAALTIAEALIGTSLRDDETRGRAALMRALALAPAGEDVVVAVSPDDFAVLDGKAELDLTRTITLVVDPSLSPGDATATCGATAIDARLSAGLARVREVLA